MRTRQKWLILRRISQAILVFLSAVWGKYTYAQPYKLAIVIDDVGYHQQEDANVFTMPKAIAVAIIPAAPYARERNQQAYAQGRDILIHMPMQPMSNQAIEEGGLHLGMSQQQVSQRVQQAQEIVSHAIGMNNHMGSAATVDETLMHYLMAELQRQKLFFLDSRTIGHSVASKVAKHYGVKSLERHIFLDDSNKLSDVQYQFQQAINYARKHGVAVVIGHPRKNTLVVLQTGLSQLPSDIQLVSISSLWRDEKAVPIKPFILLFNDIPAPTSVAPFERQELLRGVPE